MNAEIRLAAAALLTAACAGIGFSMAAAQSRRAKTLAGLARSVRRLEIAMMEKRLPLGEAMKEAGHALFEQAALSVGELGPDKSLRAAAKRLSARGGVLDSLARDDMTALSRLAGELGQGGAERQRLLLEETAGEISALAESAARRASEESRLYTSLGALGGLALAVLLV